MTRILLVVVVTAGGALAAVPGARHFDFEADREGREPRDLSFARTKELGKPGRWVVQAAADAPSGKKVLAQLDPDPTDDRYPVAVASAPSFADGELKVRCKPISGKVDQACGLVFRYRDQNNYYLTRLNALEDNVRLYFVKDGKRKQLASWSGRVAPGAWHELAARILKDEITVTFDGKKVLTANDQTFTESGKAGVWTKADSVTYFDDLAITPR
jgi:hypothetical protein